MKLINAELLKNMLKASNNYLKANVEKVNALNVFPVPDGDTGTNMSYTLSAAVKEINGNNFSNVSELAQKASFGSLKGARGNSGVILSQLIRGFAKQLKDCKDLDTETFVKALTSATESAYRAVMKPTEGTILTVARGIAEDANNYFNSNKDIEIEELLEVCIKSGRKWLNKTPDLLPVLKEANVVDAGGMGLLIIFEGAYSYLVEGKLFEDYQETEIIETSKKDYIQNFDINFTYCTEFFINGLKKNIEKEFKEYLENIGDSIIVIQEGELLKTHVHTNYPGKVLDMALKYGELTNIKIDNMKYQHNEVISALENNYNIKEEEKITKKYGFIAVSAGEGFSEILKGLGVDIIIEGGQTMNPSTEDFINAIKSLPAENIFIFPNNKNIILAAEQSIKMINTIKNIHIFKTKNIPQCISALIKFDINANLGENINIMNEAIDGVVSAEITYAVRSTKLNGFDIKEGDIIGIIQKEIVSTGNNIYDVLLDTSKKIIENNQTKLLSIYYGTGVEEEILNNYVSKINEIYPDIDVEVYPSGNEIYYFVIASEK
ncbi:DAK2 domain-containing protein [Caldicellulosiruptoraceae bacterium PP1]